MRDLKAKSLFKLLIEVLRTRYTTRRVRNRACRRINMLKKMTTLSVFRGLLIRKKCSQKRSFFLDFATLTAQISDLFCLATFIDHCACRPHWLVIWWVIILTIWKIAIIPSISNNDQHMKLEGDFYHHWDELYRYRGERHYQQKYDNHYKLLWCTPQNR